MADNRIDEIRKRLEKEPGSRLFAQLAEELRKEGELSDAIRVARTGLLQHPAYTSARMTLGRALLDTGDASGARSQFETVLRGAPDNILASRFLGETLEVMGDLGSALLQYRATLRLAPGDKQIEAQIRALEERLGAPTLRKVPPPPPPLARPSVPPLPTVSAEAPAPPSREPSPVEAPPLPPPAPPPTETLMLGVAELAPPSPLASPLPHLPTTDVSFDFEAPVERAAEAPAPLRPPEPLPPPPPPPPAAPPPEIPRAVTPEPAPPLPLDLPFASPTEASFDLEAPFETTAAARPTPEPSPGRRLSDHAVVEAGKAFPPAVAPVSLEPPPGVREPVLIPEPEPTPAPPRPAEIPALSSSTLAELYFNQGFTDQAVEVYKDLLQKEPENERLRARLAEITPAERHPQAGTSPASGVPTADPRAERRRALEQTIARFEGLLAAIKRG